MIQDHTPIPVDTFGGLYGRDSYTDSVPSDHFIDSLNTITIGDEIRTRYGFTKTTLAFGIYRHCVYKRQGEADRVLVLDTSGNLFDTTVSTSIPILTVASMVDFCWAQAYNRIYISPHNGTSGLSGSFVYVYNGTGTARKAAGVAPSSGFTVAISATNGNVEPGTHILAWCYETDSGFITPPGPATFQTVITDGTKALDFSNIPVGPSGTSARRLIASRAIQDYNGDQEGYEMFFVSGGRIANNVDTTLSAIDFFDADLQESADYTFDQLEEIPAVLFMSSFQDRIVYGNTNTDKSLAYVSKKNEPESINSLAGFIVCDPAETEGIKAGVEFRKNLYITKGNPGSTYATTDNGYDASTWPLDRIDSSVGCDVNGISQFTSIKGSTSDFFIVADNSGLFLFTGTYGDPKYHLAYKIQNWWARINKAAINKLQLVVDPEQFLIYVSVPLDAATSPNYIFVGDYSQGFDWKNIKWHIWYSAAFAPSSIAVRINNTTKKTYLSVAGFAANLYSYDTAATNDDNNAIDSYIQFALLYDPRYPNWVQHFSGLELRIKGSGTLAITQTALDATLSTTLQSLTLAASPGGNITRPCNMVNEKCSTKIRVSTTDHYFIIRAYYLYASPLWMNRPA